MSMNKIYAIEEKIASVETSIKEAKAEIEKISAPFDEKIADLQKNKETALAKVYNSTRSYNKYRERLLDELKEARKENDLAEFSTRAPATFAEFKKWIEVVGVPCEKNFVKIKEYFLEPLACREKLPGFHVIAAQENGYDAKKVYCVFRGAKLVAWAVVHPSGHPGDYTVAEASIEEKEVVFEEGINGVTKPAKQFFGACRARLLK
jgi:hypothetical protein